MEGTFEFRDTKANFTVYDADWAVRVKAEIRFKGHPLVFDVVYGHSDQVDNSWHRRTGYGPAITCHGEPLRSGARPTLKGLLGKDVATLNSELNVAFAEAAKVHKIVDYLYKERVRSLLFIHECGQQTGQKMTEFHATRADLCKAVLADPDIAAAFTEHAENITQRSFLESIFEKR